MSDPGYPAGVSDSHPHFTDNTEPDDDDDSEDLYLDHRTELRGWIWPKDAIDAASYEYEFAHGEILSLGRV